MPPFYPVHAGHVHAHIASLKRYQGTYANLPLMLSPPINYTIAEYGADIGLTYAMIPAITIGIALAAARPKNMEKA